MDLIIIFYHLVISFSNIYISNDQLIIVFFSYSRYILLSFQYLKLVITRFYFCYYRQLVGVADPFPVIISITLLRFYFLSQLERLLEGTKLEVILIHFFIITTWAYSFCSNLQWFGLDFCFQRWYYNEEDSNGKIQVLLMRFYFQNYKLSVLCKYKIEFKMSVSNFANNCCRRALIHLSL